MKKKTEKTDTADQTADPEIHNREIPEEDVPGTDIPDPENQIPEPMDQIPEPTEPEIPEELKPIFSLLPKDMPEIEMMKKKIIFAWEKTDPEIRENNPVWQYSVKDNQVVFIFRSGQKVRINL